MPNHSETRIHETDNEHMYEGRHRLKAGPEAGQLPEQDQIPESAGLLENLRAALLLATDPETKPGMGLSELRRLYELALQDRLPAEVAIEALGMAHTLDEAYARHARARGISKEQLARDRDYQREQFAQGRTYEKIFEQLKVAIYGTPDVVPDVIDMKLGGKNNAEKTQTVPWTGIPIQVRATQFDVMQKPVDDANLQNFADTDTPNDPRSAMELRLGPEETWHVQIGGSSADIALRAMRPGDVAGEHTSESIVLGPKQLGEHQDIDEAHIGLRNASPLGLEVTDNSRLGTYVRMLKYPDPRQFRHEHEKVERERFVDDARRTIDQL